MGITAALLFDCRFWNCQIPMRQENKALVTPFMYVVLTLFAS